MTGRIHPDDIALIAQATAQAVVEAVAELTRHDQPPAGQELLTAAQVAQRFGLSREWVYDNAGRLGVIRLGDGPRARLRFDPGRVTEALRACSAGRQPPEPQTRATKPKRRPRARRSMGSNVELLPVLNTWDEVGTPPSRRDG